MTGSLSSHLHWPDCSGISNAVFASALHARPCLELLMPSACPQILSLCASALRNQSGHSAALLPRRWLWISGGQAVGAPRPEPISGLPSLTRAWQRGDLSNFDYLMELNLLAGRRLGDLARYPLLPWVLDMTEPPQAGMNDSQVSPARRCRHLQRSWQRREPISSRAVHADAGRMLASCRRMMTSSRQGGGICRAASGGWRRATSS